MLLLIVTCCPVSSLSSTRAVTSSPKIHGRGEYPHSALQLGHRIRHMFTFGTHMALCPNWLIIRRARLRSCAYICKYFNLDGYFAFLLEPQSAELSSRILHRSPILLTQPDSKVLEPRSFTHLHYYNHDATFVCFFKVCTRISHVETPMPHEQRLFISLFSFHNSKPCCNIYL